MDSRHALMALAALVLVVGMAAPAAAQDNATVDDGDDVDTPDDDNETDDGDDLNETEDDVNETEDENETGRERDEERARRGPGAAQGKSAQFDARLMTAINTVDALTEMAPNDDAEQRLEKALSILRGVQEDTDTASGPGNATRDRDRQQDQTQDRDQDQDQETPENATGGDEETDGRGPPENGNRPGFVQNMLRGLFG
ncbi:MAG: hypothetical protein ABEJ62_01010 [Candidatus Nanohaloarchaea archaeon]